LVSVGGFGVFPPALFFFFFFLKEISF